MSLTARERDELVFSMQEVSSTSCLPSSLSLDLASSPMLILTLESIYRVSYCSRECQKKDYKVHRHICLAFTACLEARPPSSLFNYPTLLTFPTPPHEMIPIMRALSLNLIGPLQKKLGERMGRIATGLAFNQPRCGSCRGVDVAGRRLKKCPGCFYRYCSKEVCRATGSEHQMSGECEILRRIEEDERHL